MIEKPKSKDVIHCHKKIFATEVAEGPDRVIRPFFVWWGVARFASLVHESDAVSEIARSKLPHYKLGPLFLRFQIGILE